MTLPDTVSEYVYIALVPTLLIVPKVLQTVDFDPAHGSEPRPAVAPD
jgi:hypothetical protein